MTVFQMITVIIYGKYRNVNQTRTTISQHIQRRLAISLSREDQKLRTPGASSRINLKPVANTVTTSLHDP